MEIEICWENFESYIKFSIEKWHFSFFYPIFPELGHFIQLWKITPFFYNNFFGFGGGKLPPLRAPLECNSSTDSLKDGMERLKKRGMVFEICLWISLFSLGMHSDFNWKNALDRRKWIFLSLLNICALKWKTILFFKTKVWYAQSPGRLGSSINPTTRYNLKTQPNNGFEKFAPRIHRD